jgi:cell division protein FtsW (lipid II flippase)
MMGQRIPDGPVAYAIGSGGLLGVGLGKSRQKFLYLPEEHNEFILPLPARTGFIGASFILILFATVIIRAIGGESIPGTGSAPF